MTTPNCCDASCGCHAVTTAPATATAIVPAPAVPAPAVTTPSTTPISTPDVREVVREGYARIAQAGTWNATKATSAADPTGLTAEGSCCAGGGCCGPSTFTPEQLAHAIGYSQGELGSVPDAANRGLSCGNPTALATLRLGETVLDLGAGGGFDCFIAGPKVGTIGRVIGVDMTTAMLTKARANAQHYTRTTGLSNVEFRLGEIENLPVADASVDVVISNCVLNLSPDKARVWREIARALRPGGRVAISDLALLRPLPDSVRADVEALVGCIAGASLVEEIRAHMLAAGLVDVELTPKNEYVAALSTWKDPLYLSILERLSLGTTVADYVTSLDMKARKPA
jgi:SAM-dependent methyltransferase